MPPEEMEEFPKWEPAVISQPEVKKPKMSDFSSMGSVITSRQDADIPWSCLDLVKAANLLYPKIEQVSFQDEEEMRRIFALLYDVFRCRYFIT